MGKKEQVIFGSGEFLSNNGLDIDDDVYEGILVVSNSFENRTRPSLRDREHIQTDLGFDVVQKICKYSYSTIFRTEAICKTNTDPRNIITCRIGNCPLMKCDRDE